MKEYIEYYFDERNKFTAAIHKNGKYRVIKSDENLLKLMEISEKHGYHINSDGIIKYGAGTITKEFDKYIRRKKRLNIIGNIARNMILSRKNPILGKILVTSTLMAVLVVNGISGKKRETYTDNIDNYLTSQSSTTPMIKSSIPEILEDYSYENDTNINNTNNEQKQTIQSEEKEAIVTEDNLTAQDNSTKEELNRMFQDESFHYSYEDRTRKQSINNAKRYEDIFEKYANKYGLDKNLLMAMAAQESSGDHYNNLGNKKPAAGIMQVEKAVHIGNNVKAYNFETNQIETITVTQEKLNDINSNIQIGAMILREYIENNNYNIPLAIQTYNLGPGNMSKVLNTCSNMENISVSTIKNNPTNNKWLNYRGFLNCGDSKYVEHVFSYLNNTNLTVLKRNNQKVTVSLVNDQTKSMHKL